jgi:hypothetical protein
LQLNELNEFKKKNIEFNNYIKHYPLTLNLSKNYSPLPSNLIWILKIIYALCFGAFLFIDTLKLFYYCSLTSCRVSHNRISLEALHVLFWKCTTNSRDHISRFTIIWFTHSLIRLPTCLCMSNNLTRNKSNREEKKQMRELFFFICKKVVAKCKSEIFKKFILS